MGKLVVAVVTVLVTVACGMSGTGGVGGSSSVWSSQSVPSVGQGASEAFLHEAEALVDTRHRAVLDKNRAVFAATLADLANPFGVAELARFDLMTRLPVAVLHRGPLHLDPGPVGTIRYLVSWRLAGFDRADRTSRETYLLTETPDGWRFSAAASSPGSAAALGQTAGFAPDAPWDIAGARHQAGTHSLVIGDVPEAELAAYVKMADRSVTRVSRHWPKPWPKRLLVVVPATLDGYHGQLSTIGEDQSQVAAVTDGPLDANGKAVGDHIVLNPQGQAQLNAQGRAFVLVHEATHVAVRAALGGRVPMWLSEGFADWVGYLDTTLPDTVIAAALLDRVRAGDSPRRLPVASDFDSSSAQIAAVYNASWLAVHEIADRHGEAMLLEFYEASAARGSEQDAKAACDRALQSVLGADRATFTEQWLARVRQLAVSSR